MKYEGKLITSKTKGENGRVYLVENGKKRWVTSPRVFNNLGFKWEEILRIDDTELGLIPAGSNITDSSSSSNNRDRYSNFGKVAYKLLKGIGLEIGCLHRPFDLDATVLYLDRYTTEELKDRYKNNELVKIEEIQNVHFVSKSDYYSFIDNNAFDFVVNSHVLEHTCNPGRVIEEWIRIVKPKTGIVYMVVPDKNYCFDRTRVTTTIEHLLDDYHNNIQNNTIEHYEDYYLNSELGQENKPTREFIEHSYNIQESIHAHTYTAESLKSFLFELQKYVPYKMVYFEAQGLNIHVALQKR